MTALERLDAEEARCLLEPEVWEAPRRLTPDELIAHGGGALRSRRRSHDETEDDQ